MKTANFQLEELTCPSCIKKIEKALGQLKGVSEVKVSFNLSKVKVSYMEDVIHSDEIANTISTLGYRILVRK
jgi:copper chaperone